MLNKRHLHGQARARTSRADCAGTGILFMVHVQDENDLQRLFQYWLHLFTCTSTARPAGCGQLLAVPLAARLAVSAGVAWRQCCRVCVPILQHATIDLHPVGERLPLHILAGSFIS